MKAFDNAVLNISIGVYYRWIFDHTSKDTSLSEENVDELFDIIHNFNWQFILNCISNIS